jgi:hypothetical protein
MHMLLKINTQQYSGERFVANDDRTWVAATYTDKTRSEFGNFLRSQDLPLREHLLGGVWSTGWPLLDLAAQNAKLHSEGLKTVDGASLIAVSYKPKKTSDLSVTLYFDPQTFRHVMTTYKANISAGLAMDQYVTAGGSVISQGATETASARQNETRYQIVERFSEFDSFDGLTLPSRYNLRYTQELQSGFTKTVEWDVTEVRIQHNVPLDAKNFETH